MELEGSLPFSQVFSCRQLQQNKPWFHEEWSKFIDLRREAKLEWLLNLYQMSEDNMNKLRCEPDRIFRNKEERQIWWACDNVSVKYGRCYNNKKLITNYVLINIEDGPTST